MNRDQLRITLTAIVTTACIYSMYLTHGETGIGWLIFGLIVIWG